MGRAGRSESSRVASRLPLDGAFRDERANSFLRAGDSIKQRPFNDFAVHLYILKNEKRRSH